MRAFVPFTLLALVATVRAGCVVENAVCYVDDGNRILGQNDQNYADGLSNEWCAQLCANINMTLAGTEDGGSVIVRR